MRSAAGPTGLGRWRRRRRAAPPPDSSPAAPQAPRARWPSFPPPAYLGQLEPAFQRSLDEERGELRREDCDFYHTSVLSSGEVIKGAWDLRGSEDEYLGGFDFGSKRVLELGPASGHLTFHMERAGAEVVCFEAGYDVPIDLLPVPGTDVRDAPRYAMERVWAMQSSWWYVHRDLRSAAKMVHGSIYALPGDLGSFDVAVFGAILLHLRDPFSALAEAARVTRGALVVTDSADGEETDVNLMRFDPAPDARTNWWSISPGAVIAMLRRVGFGRTSLTFHSQKHHWGHELDAPPVDMRMFTVVGQPE